MNTQQVRKSVIDVCQRLYLHKFIANHDGNISVKLPGDRFLITPTAESKKDITEEMLITVNSEGKVVSGRLKPFSELKFHLTAFKIRPDVRAVVHAHPPYAMALACSGKTLSTKSFPEAIVSLGSEIPLTQFSIPGSKESAEAITNDLLHSDVLLLSHNGVLAVGDTPLHAYYRIELVEHLAKMTHIAGKDLQAIPDKAIETLLKKREASGIGPVRSSQDSTDRIVQEVIRQLR